MHADRGKVAVADTATPRSTPAGESLGESRGKSLGKSLGESLGDDMGIGLTVRDEARVLFGLVEDEAVVLVGVVVVLLLLYCFGCVGIAPASKRDV